MEGLQRFRPQQPNYSQPQTSMQHGYQQHPPPIFNQMGYQQNTGYQQPFPSQQYQNFDNSMNFSNGNTGNYYSQHFNNQFQFQGNPNFPNNPNFSGQGQTFGNTQPGVGQGGINGNPNFNPFDLLGRRI